MPTRPMSVSDPKYRHETWLARVNDRFGVVLVLLIVTFMVLAAGFTTHWMLPITVALLGGTFLAVLAARASRCAPSAMPACSWRCVSLLRWRRYPASAPGRGSPWPC